MAPDRSEWSWAMASVNRIDNRLWYAERNSRLGLHAHNTVRGPSNHDESWVCSRAHFDRRLIVREAEAARRWRRSWRIGSARNS